MKVHKNEKKTRDLVKTRLGEKNFRSRTCSLNREVTVVAEVEGASDGQWDAGWWIDYHTGRGIVKSPLLSSSSGGAPRHSCQPTVFLPSTRIFFLQVSRSLAKYPLVGRDWSAAFIDTDPRTVRTQASGEKTSKHARMHALTHLVDTPP